MKKIILILFLAASFQIHGQKIDVSKFRVTMQADSLSLADAFRLIKYSAPAWKLFPVSKYFYELYVVKNGKLYYKPYLPFMRKNRAYVVSGSHMNKVTISSAF